MCFPSVIPISSLVAHSVHLISKIDPPSPTGGSWFPLIHLNTHQRTLLKCKAEDAALHGRWGGGRESHLRGCKAPKPGPCHLSDLSPPRPPSGSPAAVPASNTPGLCIRNAALCLKCPSSRYTWLIPPQGSASLLPCQRNGPCSLHLNLPPLSPPDLQSPYHHLPCCTSFRLFFVV